MIDPSDRAEVVMTVTRAIKGRWVAQSRARGQKLTDWLMERIEPATDQDAATDSYESPTPEEIRAAREAVEWSQAKAAGAVLVDLRTWQRWEYGERKMPPGLWKLFRLESGLRSA